MSVSADESATTTHLRRLGPESVILFATVLVGLSVRGGSPGAGLAALVAVVLLGWMLWAQRHMEAFVPDFDAKGERRLLAAVTVFAVLGLLGWAPSAIGPSTVWLERLPGVAWLLLALPLHLKDRRSVRVVVALSTVALSLVIGLLHLDAVDGIGLDVNLLHREAAAAIANGENPYTDAVETPDGSPLAEPGATIVGYPYPPVTAISYAAGDWLFSDPRYVSLFAWLIVLGMMGVAGVRERGRSTSYLMLLLASIPGWPLVLRAGWTEPLSLALIAGAFFWWWRAGRSGLALGLGLASKQYFAIIAPIALLHRDDGWRRRVIVAIAVVGVTVGAALALDVDAFWSAAIEFHTNTPPRPDSSNFVGLLAGVGVEWAPPALVSLLAGLIAAAVFGRSSRTRNTFVLSMALALGVTFLLSTQAFANYWFLVTGLCVLGLLPAAQDPIVQGADT